MTEHNDSSSPFQEKSQRRPLLSAVEILREKFSESLGLPVASVLDESEIERTLIDCQISYRKRLFCPIVTLWTWVSMVLDADKSCKKALSRVIGFLVSAGKSPPSTNTGAFCKAKKRLSETFLLRLMKKTANEVHDNQPAHWLWHSRKVKVVDGSTLLMTDTEANQEEYPQHKKQAKGAGFPFARIAVLFGLSTGVVTDCAISDKHTSEVNLFRGFFDNFDEGDVVVGDRIFSSYADISQLLKRGVDAVFRQNGRRKSDFRRGRRLGKYDHLVVWKKPKQRPNGLCEKWFSQLPDEMLVRELRIFVERRGFRTKLITLVTTLLDAVIYCKTQIAELYQLRWQAEINLRHLKTAMTLEFLTSKTPQMARKEFYVHLLAYNLLRTVQTQAAVEHGGLPIDLSFSATQKHLSIFISLIVTAERQMRRDLYTLLLVLVATEKLLRRKNRIEPRAVKRRPKPYPKLNKPRAFYQQEAS